MALKFLHLILSAKHFKLMLILRILIKRLRWWVHKFLLHDQLVFRRPKRVLQHTSEEAENISSSFTQSTMTLIHMKCVNSDIFVNMDETAVCSDNHYKYTANEKGAKTVSVRHGSSAHKRCTVFVTVSTDGTKLPVCYFQKC